MTIEELFGTLQQATVASWRKHLRTAKYAKHMALDEFYKELPEKVDALIEGYMGAYGKKVKNFENILKSSNMNTLKYLQELKKVCKDGYDLLDDNEELESLLDDIVNLINSTLYKVKELNEHKMKNLVEFINEALSIPKRYSEAFTYDDLGMDTDEAAFIKKYLKTDKIYLLAELDENDRRIKQFDKLFDLLNKSKELETFNFEYSTYIAYELPKGTIVVFMEDPGYSGSCFYLAANKINEALVNEAKKVELDFEDVMWAIEKCSDELKWYKELRHNSVDDVLEYYTIYYALERELGVDEDTIRDFVADHEDELRERLEDL